jgi:hypothetical protein
MLRASGAVHDKPGGGRDAYDDCHGDYRLVVATQSAGRRRPASQVRTAQLLSKIKAAAAPAHAPVFDIAGIQIVDGDRPVDAKVAGISPVVVDGAVVKVDAEEFGVVTLLRYPVSGKHRSGESCKRDERRKGCRRISIHRSLPSISARPEKLSSLPEDYEWARAIFAAVRTSDPGQPPRHIIFCRAPSRCLGFDAYGIFR